MKFMIFLIFKIVFVTAAYINGIFKIIWKAPNFCNFLKYRFLRKCCYTYMFTKVSVLSSQQSMNTLNDVSAPALKMSRKNTFTFDVINDANRGLWPIEVTFILLPFKHLNVVYRKLWKYVHLWLRKLVFISAGLRIILTLILLLFCLNRFVHWNLVCLYPYKSLHSPPSSTHSHLINDIGICDQKCVVNEGLYSKPVFF